MILPTVMLIRHGETGWTLSGQHTGRSDIPLTAAGEDSARELAPILAPIVFSDVFTSPSRRARRTCELVLAGRSATIEPDLAEWDYGRYDGLDTRQIQAQQPGWNVFRDGGPGGETPAQASARADRLLDRLRGLKGTIALFSHGQFGCLLGARWIGLTGAQADHFALEPASISVLGPKPGHGDVPVIARWNVVPAARL
jgi:probable phosphoglycerate mutase